MPEKIRGRADGRRERRGRRGDVGRSSCAECSASALTRRGRVRTRSATIPADVAAPTSRPREPPARCASACSARAPSAARSSARCSSDRRASPRPTARRSCSPASPSGTWRGRSAAGIPEALLTDAPAHLVASADVDVIVELMGGDEPARTLIAAALADGQARSSPRTSTSSPTTGPELERDRPRGRRPAPLRGRGRRRHPGPRPAGARTSPRTGSRASAASSTARRTSSSRAMAREGRDYADVARRGAGARATPRPTRPADVEGLDAVNKLVILARLAFGAWIDPAAVSQPARHDARRGDGAPGHHRRHRRGRRRAARPRAACCASSRRRASPTTARIEASVVPTAVPAGLAVRALRRRAQPGRGRRRRRSGRVAFEGPGAGGRRDRVGRARRPRRDRARRSARPGPGAAAPRRAIGASPVRPVASECVAAPSGACYPSAD